MLAPIVLFVYNRPGHTKKTLDALSNNVLISDSILIVYADGPKENSSSEELELIAKTRSIIRKVCWCKKVHLVERNRNFGLANNIVTGVTEVVNKYDKIIVLEDDIITSRGFLKYMNEALDLYEYQERVMQVSGYMHPTKLQLPETLFYNVNSCWGWGTWGRAWNNYIVDAKVLLERVNTKYDGIKFNGGQGDAFYNQLIDNSAGRLNTWAVKWHASMYLLNGYILHPGKSLVRNIGHDSSGTNCGYSSIYNQQKIIEFVKVNRIPLKENREIVESFLKLNKRNFPENIFFIQVRKIKYFIKKVKKMLTL